MFQNAINVRGYGRVFKDKINKTYENSEICDNCNGHGYKQERSRKFLDIEIKDIVKRLGAKRVAAIIRNYKKGS